jgi:hypothetical protein
MVITTFKMLLSIFTTWITVANASEQSLAHLTDEELDRMVTNHLTHFD